MKQFTALLAKWLRHRAYVVRIKGFLDFLISFFVADDYSIDVKLNGLPYKQVRAVVGGKEFNLEKVAVLADDVKRLSSYGSGRSQYGYMSFFHSLELYV